MNRAELIYTLETLWRSSKLTGPFLKRGKEPREQKREEDLGVLSDVSHLYGVLTHHDEARSPFYTSVIEDEEGTWIYAGAPVGGLPHEWDVGGYPFASSSPDWLEPLLDTLRSLADETAEHTSVIRGAIYGWLTVNACDELEAALKGDIPKDRWLPISIYEAPQNFFPATHPETCSSL